MGTSRLQAQTVKALDRIFGCSSVKENARPEWLVSPGGGRLEIDVYIPRLKIAVEVQGIQHYQYTPHFHGDADGFTRRLKFDEAKRSLCRKRGITLYEITSESELADLVAQLQGKESPTDAKYLEKERRSADSRQVEAFYRYARRRMGRRRNKQRNANRRLNKAIKRGAPEARIRQLQDEAAIHQRKFACSVEATSKEFQFRIGKFRSGEAGSEATK